MNKFFVPHGDVGFEIPRIAYARVDQVEPIEVLDSEVILLTFSAVDGDWYADYQEYDLYNLSMNSTAPELWRQYWKELFNNIKNTNRFANPFDEFPLLRFEVEVTKGSKYFEYIKDISSDEESWFILNSYVKSALQADVYGNLFGEPKQTNISINKLGVNESRVLSSTFDMVTWPDATPNELKLGMYCDKRAEFLAAFDVGQGSASALLDDHQVPFLYHDLGAGVTRNAKTAPANLKFCWTNKPFIILSHWDSDHWAGAKKDPKALEQTWIAPRQKLGPTHTAFANDILLSGGSLLIWPSGVKDITIRNTSKQSITVGRCTGSGRNGTGLAIRVDDNVDDDTLHWLLTGDSGYHQLPFSLPGNLAAVIVPHHGATMAGRSQIPARLSSRNYARLLFSFGPGNSHGPRGTSHPTISTINSYDTYGWDMGRWKGANVPGNSIARGDVLATAEHSSKHLGGIVAGWNSAPVVTPRPCGNRHCSIKLKQS